LTELVEDLQIFYHAAQSLTANGGFDAPEYALYAMLEGFGATKLRKQATGEFAFTFFSVVAHQDPMASIRK